MKKTQKSTNVPYKNEHDSSDRVSEKADKKGFRMTLLILAAFFFIGIAAFCLGILLE